MKRSCWNQKALLVVPAPDEPQRQLLNTLPAAVLTQPSRTQYGAQGNAPRGDHVSGGNYWYTEHHVCLALKVLSSEMDPAEIRLIR
jgi:hypothetical protein